MFAGGHHRWSRQWEPPESCGRLRSCRDLGQRLDPGWLRASLLCTAVGHSRSTAKCLLLAVTNVTLRSVAIFVCHKLTFYLCASFGPLGPTHMALTLPGFPRLTRPRTQEQKCVEETGKQAMFAGTSKVAGGTPSVEPLGPSCGRCGHVTEMRYTRDGRVRPEPCQHYACSNCWHAIKATAAKMEVRNFTAPTPPPRAQCTPQNAHHLNKSK